MIKSLATLALAAGLSAAVPAIARIETPTKLFMASPDSVMSIFARKVYPVGYESFRYTCQFIANNNNDAEVIRLCKSDIQQSAGSQLLVRSHDGVLRAVSLVVQVTNSDIGVAAESIDMLMAGYLSGKGLRPDVADTKAKDARVALIDGVMAKGRIQWRRSDATITGYLKAGKLHLDIDSAVDREEREGLD